MDNPDNPYASPASSEAPGLSRTDRAVLEFYLRHRERLPTLLSLSVKFFPGWCAVWVLSLAAAVIMFLLFGSSAGIVCALLLGGMAIGALSRDVGFMRRTVQQWPLTTRILDWKKIEQLLDPDKSG